MSHQYETLKLLKTPSNPNTLNPGGDSPQDMVKRAAEPGSSGLHLYTAPPKAVLKTPSATLFEAGLAPAAVVYVGTAAGGPPRLRPDVLALQVEFVF